MNNDQTQPLTPESVSYTSVESIVFLALRMKAGSRNRQSRNGRGKTQHFLGTFCARTWVGCSGFPVVYNMFYYFFFLLNLFFIWRTIALQYYVGFCHTTTWISHNYISILSLWNLPPHPIHPSRSSQRGLLCYIAASHQLSVLCMRVYAKTNP